MFEDLTYSLFGCSLAYQAAISEQVVCHEPVYGEAESEEVACDNAVHGEVVYEEVVCDEVDKVV